jgi:glycosyltransferase involved in cell wall biosynthesis
MARPPVLVTACNRPIQTRQLLHCIADEGVAQVFAHIDIPKGGSDAAHTEVAALFDEPWPFHLQLTVAEQHLGCKMAMENAIDHFFRLNEEGIILEDDCLPQPGFFDFVERMLGLYRLRADVMMVSAHLPIGKWHNGSDHALTATGQIWGWATWRRAWQLHRNQREAGMKMDAEVIRNRFGDTPMAAELTLHTTEAINGQLDTWDYQWMHTVHHANGLCAMPTKNLVLNNGFGTDATHTPTEPKWHLLLRDIRSTDMALGPAPDNRDRELEMAIYRTVRGNIRIPFNRPSSWYSQSGRDAVNLKIAHLNTAAQGGGAERLMRDLMSAQRDDNEVNALVAHGADFTQHLYPIVSGLKWLGLAGSRPDLARSISALPSVPDVIHLHNLHGTGLSVRNLETISNKIPILWTLHDQWLLADGDGHPFTPSSSSSSKIKTIKQMVDEGRMRLVAPSVWLADRVSAHLNVPVHVVRNGIDTSIFRPVDKPRKGLLFVANRPETNPYKDFGTLREAWRMLNKTSQEPIDLLCVGGELRTEKHGEGTLSIIPFITDRQVLASHHQRCAVYVHASLDDNFPLSLLEALACGAKSVAAQVGGIPEVEADPHLLRLYTCRDADNLATAILAALSDHTPDSRGAYDIRDTAAAYLGHYADISGRG